MNVNITCPQCEQTFPVEIKVVVGSEPKRTSPDHVTVDVTADITEAGHAAIAEHVAGHDEQAETITHRQEVGLNGGVELRP